MNWEVSRFEAHWLTSSPKPERIGDESLLLDVSLFVPTRYRPGHSVERNI